MKRTHLRSERWGLGGLWFPTACSVPARSHGRAFAVPDITTNPDEVTCGNCRRSSTFKAAATKAAEEPPCPK